MVRYRLTLDRQNPDHTRGLKGIVSAFVRRNNDYPTTVSMDVKHGALEFELIPREGGKTSRELISSLYTEITRRNFFTGIKYKIHELG